MHNCKMPCHLSHQKEACCETAEKSKTAAGPEQVQWRSDLSTLDYIKALEEELGKSSVFQIMKMSSQVLVGLASVNMAELLVEEGLTIGTTHLKAFPYKKRAEKITIGNLPIAIRDEDVVAALRPYCRVVSLNHEVVTSGGYTWTTCNREAFVLLNEERKLHQLPANLVIVSKGESTPAYITYGIECGKCHQKGNRRASCPLKAHESRPAHLQDTLSGPESPSFQPTNSTNSAERGSDTIQKTPLVEELFESLNANTIVEPLYENFYREEIEDAVVSPSNRGDVLEYLTPEQGSALKLFLDMAIAHVGEMSNLRAERCSTSGQNVTSYQTTLSGIRLMKIIFNLSLVGRARAANSLVLSSVVNHLHGYLPTDSTISKLQARLVRFVWGPGRTAWLPGGDLARPVSMGGFGLLDVGTQLRLACMKGVQASLRGSLNAYSWLTDSGAWLTPLPSRHGFPLDVIWEAVSDFLALDHRIVPTQQLRDVAIIGGCRFHRPPDLLAAAQWIGARIGDFDGPVSLLTRPTRCVLADATALANFCNRLIEENLLGSHRADNLGEAVVLRGTVTPLTVGWPSLRRCAFSEHNADNAVQLALHALPHPAHPASARETCIACGSSDLTLAHRYWSCSSIRPLIREAFYIIQQPPDLQGWLFGQGLDEDALAILASAKTSIHRFLLSLEMRGERENPLTVWRRTLSLGESPRLNNETRKHANFASNDSISYANWADLVEALENTSNSEGYQKPKGAKRKDWDPKADNIPARPSQPPKRVTRDAVIQLKNNQQQQALSKARSAAASFDQCCYIEYCADFSPVQYTRHWRKC
ncbi:hypothetical protein LAZ67_8001783 [Cordylochernes scorpioides]|uniref:Uncharacterized protein n=1 Tax=Cordylochernes scorpioides TaxID=51811 RepID=A0ABY6KQH3_9ARAC|nr:hypothetical protein LAZ67_8001783 [Cordylochernes scorpioides]